MRDNLRRGLRRRLAAVLLPVCLAALSACSFRLQSVDSLIRAPKLTGKNLLVQQALEKSAGADIILKIPVVGAYSSAFVYQDIDGDGTEECVAFYALKEGSDAAHMSILAEKNGSWTSVCDTVGSGSDVDSLAFADVDGDGVYELIVTWDIPESKGNRFFTLYGRYGAAGGVAALMNEMFTAVHPLDVNGDGKDEIFMTSLDTANNEYVAYGSLFAYDAAMESMTRVSRIDLYPAVTSYLNIAHDYADSVCRIYIDGVVSRTHMVTELLEIPADSLVLRAPSVSGKSFPALTLRAGRVCCEDVDGDGQVELPLPEEMPDGGVVDRENGVSESLYATVWSRYADGALDAVERYVTAPDGAYLFVMPDGWWNDGLTAVADLKNQRVSFYGLDGARKKEHMLFYIETARLDGSPQRLSAGGMLYRDNRALYRASVTAAGRAAGITLADVESGFRKT